jgi:uncharacterized protein
MNIAVNRCTNANVLLGGAAMLGRAEEVDLPDVKAKMSDHKALGLFGAAELPSGIDKLEASFKWNSYYADVLQHIPNIFTSISLQVRASVETWDSTGRSAQAALVVYLTGTFKEFSAGKFKPHDNVELPSKMNVLYIKQVLNGQELYEIDVLNNIYKVGGVDMLATYRSNLGI